MQNIALRQELCEMKTVHATPASSAVEEAAELVGPMSFLLYVAQAVDEILQPRNSAVPATWGDRRCQYQRSQGQHLEGGEARATSAVT